MSQQPPNPPESEPEPQAQANGSSRSVEIGQTTDVAANLKSLTVRGGVFTLASQGTKFVLLLGSMAVLARLLTPDDFGLVAMVTAITGFVAMFKDAGLSTATIQRAEITNEQVSTLFWINVALGALVMLVVAGLAPVIASIYGDERLFGITLALSGTFIISGLMVQHQALLRRQMRFKALAVIDVLAALTGTGVAIAMAIAGAGYWALVGNLVGIVVANTVLVWLTLRWLPGLPRRGACVGSMLGFGGHLTGAAFANYWAKNTDTILLGRFYGSAETGVYERAYRLLMLPLNQMDAVVGGVLIPALSRLTEQPDRYINVIRKMQRLFLVVAVPPVVSAVVYADTIILTVLGDQWTRSIPLFRLLGLVSIIQMITRFSPWILITMGHSRTLFRYAILGCLLAIIAFVIGLPWGAQGVATALLIESVIYTPMLVHASLKVVGMRWSTVALDLRAAFTAGALTALIGMAIRSATTEPSLITGWLTLLIVPAMASFFTAYGFGLIPEARALLHVVVPERLQRTRDSA